MNITLTDSEVKTLNFYLDKSLTDAKGMLAIGIGNSTSVENLKSIKQKINAPTQNRPKSLDVYEVQLGRIADGAKDDDIDYHSPQIMLIESDHSLKIKEVEDAFSNEIRTLGCDCVYGITPVEDWELESYDCYKTCPRYGMQSVNKKSLPRITKGQQIELCRLYNSSDIDCLEYMAQFCNNEQKELLERLVTLNQETAIGWGREDYTDEEFEEYKEGKWKLLNAFGLENRDGDATFEGIAYGTADEYMKM